MLQKLKAALSHVIYISYNHIFSDAICLTVHFLSCVFQMILWDWDLKHWYKPQYQVSTVVFCSSFMLSMLHIHNTGHGFCSPPVIAVYKSPLGHSVPFPDHFLVWLNTHCVKLGILWPCNRRHATFFILLRHSLSCLNYSCNLSKNLTDTDQKKYLFLLDRVKPARTFSPFFMKPALKPQGLQLFCVKLLL